MSLRRLRLESDYERTRTVVLREDQVPFTFEALRRLVCSKLSKEDRAAAFTFTGPNGGIFKDEDVVDLFRSSDVATIYCRKNEEFMNARPRSHKRKGSRRKRNSGISINTDVSDAYDTPSSSDASAYSDTASSYDSETTDSEYGTNSRTSRTITPTPSTLTDDDDPPALKRKVSFGPTTTFTLSPTSPESPGNSPPPSGPKYLPPAPTAVAPHSALKSPSPRIVPQPAKPPSPTRRMVTKARSSPVLSPNRGPAPPPKERAPVRIEMQSVAPQPPADPRTEMNTIRRPAPPPIPDKDYGGRVKVSVVPVVPAVVPHPTNGNPSSRSSNSSATASSVSTKWSGSRTADRALGAVTVRSYKLNSPDQEEVVEIKPVHLQAMRRARSFDHLRSASSQSYVSDFGYAPAPTAYDAFSRPLKPDSPPPTVLFIPRSPPVPAIPPRDRKPVRTPSNISNSNLERTKSNSSRKSTDGEEPRIGGLVGLLRRLSNRNLKKQAEKPEELKPPPPPVPARREGSQISLLSVVSAASRKSETAPVEPLRKKPPPPPPSPARLKEIAKPSKQYFDNGPISPRSERSLEQQVEEYFPRSASAASSSLTMESPEVPSVDTYWAMQNSRNGPNRLSWGNSGQNSGATERKLLTPPAVTASGRPTPPPAPFPWAVAQAATRLSGGSIAGPRRSAENPPVNRLSIDRPEPQRRLSHYSVESTASSSEAPTSTTYLSSAGPFSASTTGFGSPVPIPAPRPPKRGSSLNVVPPAPVQSPALLKWEPGVQFRLSGKEYAFPFTWRNDVNSTASDLMGPLARAEWAPQRAWGYKQTMVNELSASIRYSPRHRSSKKRGKTGFGYTQFTIFFNNPQLFRVAMDLYVKKTSSLGPADFRHYFIRPLQAVAHLYVNETVVTEWTAVEPPLEWRGVADGMSDYHVAYIVKDMREDLTEECKTHVELWIKANMTTGEWLQNRPGFSQSKSKSRGIGVGR
ncbi:hypothetical protein M427DRAFT_155698 [Gonapodya prolifera JEL478]|uniref:Uncharacterized protein n=1 Tax=Gonapodya prolifera (strain JEL478) TaxID=1344416 RepID=A0A139AEC7_GONPJ|nr:hypothetical protein M427DRAFT_155698 [Gonapodya prolifera JEL478]|eukprot:KXS14795.1 hypothetical protein M427DRAFT_155698 [Gonapodya prolifera JEL478]